MADLDDWGDLGLGSLQESMRGSPRSSPGEGSATDELTFGGSECVLALKEAEKVLKLIESRRARIEQVQPIVISTARRASSNMLVHDAESVRTLTRRIEDIVTAVAEVLSSCAEMTKAQHPDLWQGTPDQLALSVELRNARRLVHRLKLITVNEGGTNGSK